MKLGENYGENISGKIVCVCVCVCVLGKQFKVSGNHPKGTEQMKKYFFKKNDFKVC